MNEQGKKKIVFTAGIKVILLFGLISFFGDMAYESARGNHGQYMALLGIDIVTVSFIAGIGEFIAYAVRIVSGVWVDKVRKYWLFVFAGTLLFRNVPEHHGYSPYWPFCSPMRIPTYCFTSSIAAITSACRAGS